MTPETPAGYMTDAMGRLVPEHLVKPQEVLEDQTVRKIIAYAEELSSQIGRFKGHTFEDVATFMDVLAGNYGTTRGGAKGNVTLTSYDGTMKVVVQVQETLTFGPELQVAKTLFDECIARWTEGAGDELRVLVDHAFQVDKEGRINRTALFGLRRLQIADDEWQRAVAALNDSIRVIGSREYVRFYRRADGRAQWQPISVDLASAVAPSKGEAA